MKSEVRSAVRRGLVRFGLSENMATYIAAASFASQSEEWERIVDRARRGEVTSVYLLTSERDGGHLSTFVYAPGDVDNIAEVRRLLGTRPAWGWVNSEEGIQPQQSGAYPVAVYDVAAEVLAVIRS